MSFHILCSQMNGDGKEMTKLGSCHHPMFRCGLSQASVWSFESGYEHPSADGQHIAFQTGPSVWTGPGMVQFRLHGSPGPHGTVSLSSNTRKILCASHCRFSISAGTGLWTSGCTFIMLPRNKQFIVSLFKV